ncbi:hypothetical protein PGB90_005335 [Kerria lacca]
MDFKMKSQIDEDTFSKCNAVITKKTDFIKEPPESFVDRNSVLDTVNINQVPFQFQNKEIPSTSEMLDEFNSNIKKLKYVKPNIEINDNGNDYPHFKAISRNFNNVIVNETNTNLTCDETKRRILQISREELSQIDNQLSEEESKDSSCETDSQDEIDNSVVEIFHGSQNSFSICQLSVKEERFDLHNWKVCTIGGVKRQIDMKVIEPYKRVLSHGGYLNSGSHNAIITFSACFLPHRSRVDYNYVMDNLFFYILYTLNQLITDDYILVYLHGGSVKDCIPTFSWLKKCYLMIDRKLKKNLKLLYLVHTTFWLRTLITMIKPFISIKFSRKINFVDNLTELYNILPIEDACIPDKVKQYDRIKSSLLRKQK